jgi:regulator of protease activity HflC (stomatin/prohibitin superfamily)
VQRIEAQARAEAQKLESISRAEAAKLAAESEAETQRVKTEAEVNALRERELAAKAYSTHPALLRLQELETIRELARTASARLYIGFDNHASLNSNEEKD